MRRLGALAAVLDYYNTPPQDAAHELRTLALSEPELDDLERFLRALSGVEPAR